MKRKSEWIDAVARVRDIPGTAVRLAVIMASYADSKPPFGNIFPAVPTVAAAAGVSLKTVSDHLGDLVWNGWLTVEKPGGGRGNATHYRLSVGASGWARDRPKEPRKPSNRVPGFEPESQNDVTGFAAPKPCRTAPLNCDVSGLR